MTRLPVFGAAENACSSLIPAVSPASPEPVRLPSWLRRPPRSSQETTELKRLLRTSRLNTVCEEARCPNISECFSHRTATFMILGDICTRGCRFCSVTTGKPKLSAEQFAEEGERVAEAALALGLRHVVVTSVARDDLVDGGVSGFCSTIAALRKLPEVTIEVLVPDFRGKPHALPELVAAKPDCINHNLETVPRLYRRVRPGANYAGSLQLLREVKRLDPAITTKTGIMLGLGETRAEVEALMQDAVRHDIDIFTAGQYMQPSKNHLPVTRYVPPEEFEQFREFGQAVGFKSVFSGPLVRSSYHAGEVYDSV